MTTQHMRVLVDIQVDDEKHAYLPVSMTSVGPGLCARSCPYIKVIPFQNGQFGCTLFDELLKWESSTSDGVRRSDHCLRNQWKEE